MAIVPKKCSGDPEMGQVPRTIDVSGNVAHVQTCDGGLDLLICPGCGPQFGALGA